MNFQILELLIYCLKPRSEQFLAKNRKFICAAKPPKEFFPTLNKCWTLRACSCRLGLAKLAKVSATKSRPANLFSARSNSNKRKLSTSSIRHKPIGSYYLKNGKQACGVSRPKRWELKKRICVGADIRIKSAATIAKTRMTLTTTFRSVGKNCGALPTALTTICASICNTQHRVWSTPTRKPAQKWYRT